MMTTTNPNTAFKTTDNTHRHNHTILHHIGRRLLLLTTLLAMAVGVKAQTMPTISNAPTDGNWADNVAWHHVRTNNGYYLVSNSTDGSGNLYLNSTERPIGAAGLWCVVGNSTDGYTLYNKAIGASTPLGMTGYANDGGARAKFVAVGTSGYATSFDFVQSTGRENHWAIHVHGNNSYYWNRRAPYLSNWNSNGATNDNGSAFLFTEITDLASVADITAAKNELTEGVGYPQTTSAAYQALNALDPNTTTISRTDLSTLVTAYKTSTDILLPEDGEAYQFAFTANDGNNTPYYIVVNGNTLSVSATGPGSTFYCKKFANVNGEERFAFISEEGKLMSFRTLTDIYTATGNLCNDFTVGPMVGVTSNVTSTKEQRFGSVYLTTSARSTTDATLGCFVYKFTDTKGWDASSAPFHNGNYTSAIKVTEVTSYTANDAQQLASAKIEAKVSVLGRKIPGAEVCQYTYTVNGQPSTDSNTIITAIENAADAATVNAIKNSATINQPKVGKYYRIKAYVSQKFIDAANSSNTTSAMAMRSYGNHDEQGTIFRLDADNVLFNLGTGSYVYDTYKIGENNANQANTWTFKESTRTPGCFTLTSNEATNKELHDGGDYASGCATICGASHDFILEETELPTTPAPKFVPNADFTAFTLICTNNHGYIFYTINGDDPTSPGASASTMSVGDSKTFTAVEVANVKAYAQKGAIPASPVVGVVAVNTADDLKNMTGSSYYYLATDGITASSHTSIAGFKGTFEGRFFTINNLNTPLFASADGAIIKNVVLKDVSITGGTGNVGAIVGTAQGKTRIYNCGVLSGEVGGGTNVGGIAGRIEDAARVINCYSFAKITGGNTVGGIVGNNTIASNAGNLQTLVMNCMYYGDITGGTSISPIYGGAKISNHGAEGDANGINNYNYYRYEAKITPTVYNCALAAEERYLTRFEFYRHVLNSQRKLCAFYVTGDVNDYAEIAKWVLDVSDPDAPKYPILKPWGKYASMMNRATTDRKVSTLAVTIGGTNATGATISATTTLDITNAAPNIYDYNHYKVQLPYYNEHFADNYTNNKVVTGWKITSITGGTAGTFSEEGDNRYNFADRHCTQKDLYDESDRVFAQGGYFNVPEGVTAITIEPYWGKAIYLSDSYHDVVYNNGTGWGFTPAGEASDTYNTNTQTVLHSLDNIWAQLNASAKSVYDNAVVLVGNYHSFGEDWYKVAYNGIPFTVMSVDENRDNEPDYGLYCRTAGRLNVNPIRFDFLNHVAIGMAAKEDGRSEMYNLAIWEMTGWFEITETALAIYEEFEYDASAANKAAAPLILNGGIIKQFGSTAFNYHAIEKTPYTIVGGNCYLYNYAPGCNTNTSTPIKTKFPPVSILGGEYEQFYLSGGNPAPTPYEDYDALCYGNGGKIGLFAGAYQEAIDGDVIIKLDHMLVDEFYGGGVNDKNPITGNINVTINNSQVGTYCGGPKFGNMQKVIEDGQTKTKTITTYAENTTFGQFFGAGYGGTSLFRGSNADAGRDPYPEDWLNTYFTSRKGKYYDGSVQLEGRFKPVGILVGYDTEFFSYAGGGSRNSRFYTDYASLSVAEVGDVTTTLKGCTILGDLYGGGNLGKAVGDLTTTLEDCTVKGNVYAAGFSAAVPTCEVMTTEETPKYSTYNTNTGIFTPAKYPEPETYTWAQATDALVHGQVYIDDKKKEIYTKAVDLTDLGTVRGKTKIVIKGNSVIGDAEAGTGGSVFGGGNASKVEGDTHVHIQGGTINGSVFGAGNQAEVTGKTEVVIGE